MTGRAVLLRQRLVGELISDGRLSSREWIEAFRVVPRELFVPRYFLYAETGGQVAVDDSDRDWLPPIYEDQVLTTQLDGDSAGWERARKGEHAVDGVPTCSLSQPGLTALLLEALEVQTGDRVLDVGTGTGYTAALLAHRLGGDQVTTVDVDPGLAASARIHLARAGYAPWVAVADGALGVPAHAPYDRLIATCSVPSIPRAWLEQVRVGGMVLANLHRDLAGGPTVKLVVDADGSASGRLLPEGGKFMPLRAHPRLDGAALLSKAMAAGGGARRATRLIFDPRDGEPWHLLAEMMMPRVIYLESAPADREPVLWLLHEDGSWARYEVQPGTVEQHGRRRLWDELECAHDCWAQLGKPARNRFGLTVDAAGGHALWLDDPARDHRWPVSLW